MEVESVADKGVGDDSDGAGHARRDADVRLKLHLSLGQPWKGARGKL